MLLIRGGMVHDAVRREPYAADVLIQEGKIERIAPGISCEGAEVFDAAGLQVYPGFVEAHGHSGLDGYGIGYEGQDYNEMGDILSPQLRAIDAIQPMDFALKEAREAGVTCMCVGPGSANVLGGTFAAIKPWGLRVENMLVKAEVAMKCAFGENPKRCYRDKGNSCRMSTAAKLREMLFKAREYDRKVRAAGDDEDKLPPFDMKLNALLPVIRGEMPLKAHAHQADDLFTALRIAREFGVKITLEHCTEGPPRGGGAGGGARAPGGRPLARPRDEVRAAQQDLGDAGHPEPGGLRGVHHHRFAGHPAKVPAAVRGLCGAVGHGPVRGAARDHDQPRAPHRRGGPAGLPFGGQGRGRGRDGRLAL